MKVIEVINVDFALRQFLLRDAGICSRGHQVIGVSADGPQLDFARAEGFDIRAVPLTRSLSPMASWRAYRALLALFRAERPDLVHAHMPISGFLARLAAWRAGVPVVAYTCHGFLFNQPGPLWRWGVAVEWIGGRFTDIHSAVSTEEADDARRLGIHARSVAVGNGRDPPVPRPDPAAQAQVRGALGVPDDRVVVVIVSRLVRHKGHPELLAAMRDVDAELWVVGDFARVRPWGRTSSGISPPPGSAIACGAGLPRGRAGGAGGGRHLRAAIAFRGAADVGHRGDAVRAAGGGDRGERSTRAGGGRGNRLSG